MQIDNILVHIKNNIPYQDSLSLKFAGLLQWAKPVFTTSAYEDIKSNKGLGLISNDSLRKEIILIHERFYPFALENVDNEESMIHQELMLPVFAKLFVSNENGEAVPNDYSSLQRHQEFINVITLTRTYRLMSISYERMLKERISRLDKKLDLELDRLKE